MKKTKKHESGRSMVEMVGVLAIMGLVTAGAFVLIQSGMGSQKRNRAADEIDVMVSNVRAMTAESDYTCSLPSAKLYALTGKSLASALLKSNGATPFNSKSYYSITSGEDECKEDTTFKVYLVDIGDDECATMASRAYSGARGVVCSKGTVMITFTK